MSELGRRLRDLPLPPAEQARARAASRARAIAAAPARPRRSLTLHRLRPALVAAGALVASLVGFAFTPPGQAVTEKLGELVGIGEPATLPPRDQGPHLTDRGQPVVIASGRAPDGTPYEVVANRSVSRPLVPGELAAGESGPHRVPLSSGAKGEAVTCITVDLPDEPTLETVELCVGAADREFLAGGGVLDAVNFADRAAPGEEAELAASEARYVLSAELSPEIEEVELTYEDPAGERVRAHTDVGHVDAEIAKRIGTEDRVGYLVGFLPDDGLPSAASSNGGLDERRAAGAPRERSEAGVLGTVQLVAFDGSGELVARSDFGSRIAATYARQQEERVTAERLRAQIEAAQQRDGFALNRPNVSLCVEAWDTDAYSARCRELLREAAVGGLFGLRTAGPGGEDIVLPD